MKWKDYPQNIKVRLMTSFFNRAVTSAIWPFMALFFSLHKGPIWAGVFLSINVGVAFISNLLGGYISDRFNRKQVLILSSICSAVLLLIMTVCILPETKLIYLFAGTYLFFTFTSSLSRPAMQAIIIDSTTPDNRKAIYAIDYWMVNLSMAIGAALGGWLFLTQQILLFIIVTTIATILPIVYMVWLQDTVVKKLDKVHANVWRDLVANYQVALKDRPFVKAVTGAMCIYAAEFSLNSYIGVRLAEEFRTVGSGIIELNGVRMLSLLNIQNMLLVVLLTFLITRLARNMDGKKVLLFGLIIYSIGYVLMMSANNWYLLLFVNLVATIGELLYSPVANAEKANMMPEDKRGSYSAFSGISFNGAELIARMTIIVGAFLVPSMMSVYMACILFVGTSLLYTGLFVREKKEKVNVESIA
ncbi:MDR family MFS transporter [Mangrovibacillus cuniculi]|uniref:MFS transporter n=1 Tax=Mangrovibacillus cuniculi TaxID=2593652 RepID=A0A7S8HGZ9_9BACI|nr:MFS transporter [Mangrovibacillus cuniculi]QPC48096.1 MFS transporter [Mangrovibacillus cuniculi]